MSDNANLQSQRRPQGVACTPCRRAKMKCVSSNSASATCDRCQRLQTQCIYEMHRRGLWRRNQAGKREEHQYSTHDGLSESFSGSLDDLLSNLQRPDFQTQASASYSVDSGSDQTPFTPGTLDAALNAERTFGTSSSGQFDLFVQRLQQTKNLPKNHDPIEMGLVSSPSAQILFEGFFRHFNSLIGLLDPHLYTFKYTRDRSSLLFTMILGIASRMFQPEAHTAIKERSEALLGRALLECDLGIETIWAIICMYYWKDVNDKRGEILIGFASQMAASAEWNMTRRDASNDGLTLDSTEVQVRQERDQKRIWVVLCNRERALRYFNERQLLTSLTVDNTISRTWIDLTEHNYRLGDCASVSGHEMMDIARDVYDGMRKTGEHHDSSPNSLVELESLRGVMNSFNNKIDEWGDNWCDIYSNFPDPEPLQQSITLLHRDYTCLYFNITHLHMLSTSDGRSFLTDQIAHTTCICLSSAFGILQHGVHFGNMNVIYYLWDNAHHMIAYAAMLVLKLIAQDVKQPTVSKEEAAGLLDRITTAYLVASRSMGSRESHSSECRTGNGNLITAQTQLLSAILARLDAVMIHVEETSEAREVPHITYNPDLPWLEEDIDSLTVFSYERRNQQEPLQIDLDNNAVSQTDYLNSCVAQEYDEPDLLGDKEFLKSRYLDAGLLPLDESGILLRRR